MGESDHHYMYRHFSAMHRQGECPQVVDPCPVPTPMTTPFPVQDLYPILQWRAHVFLFMTPHQGLAFVQEEIGAGLPVAAYAHGCLL